MFSFESPPSFLPGTPMPHFPGRARAQSQPFNFHDCGGEPSIVVLAGRMQSKATATLFAALRSALLPLRCLAIIAPQDEPHPLTQDVLPQFRAVIDSPQGLLATLFCPQGQRRAWVVDRRLVVYQSLELTADGVADAAKLLDIGKQLLDEQAPAQLMHAPLLTVPGVFERELCRELIAYYRKTGGIDGGFISQNAQGVTAYTVQKHQKIRQDCPIQDQDLINTVLDRIRFRLAPQIYFGFQFKVERIERHIVCRYAAAEGAFFAAHRDNLSSMTAHRRFSVALNLNEEDYVGGDLVFPEFGVKSYRTPTGAATVFSSTLLHEVTRVTQGERFAYLPFLYTEEDEKRLNAAKTAARNAIAQV